MDGVHDLGGKQGFGRVDVDDATVGFHDHFEARVFGLNVAARLAGVVKNTDQFRHAVERIEPAAYLTHSYYGRWLGGLENLFVEGGALDSAEIDAAVAARGGDPALGRAARPSASPDTVPDSGDDRSPTAKRRSRRALRFALGDRVRTLSHGSPGHTRLPAYARDRVGVVAATHGAWVYPDTNAHGGGESPQPLYTVRFEGTELWGRGSEPGTSVCIDLFEPYLDAV